MIESLRPSALPARPCSSRSAWLPRDRRRVTALVGIAAVPRTFRQRVIVLTAILVTLVLAILVMITQPRGASPHPNHQEARRNP